MKRYHSSDRPAGTPSAAWNPCKLSGSTFTQRVDPVCLTFTIWTGLYDFCKVTVPVEKPNSKTARADAYATAMAAVKAQLDPDTL